MLEGAFQATPQAVEEFIKIYKPNFPVGLVDPYFVLNYAQITPGMRPTVPIMFFIDRKGIIRAQYFGTDAFFTPEETTGERIRAEIDKILKEDRATPAKKK